MNQEAKLREALKSAGHWFNEQIRLYNDASQSLVARNFQIENYAKSGFNVCLAALSTPCAEPEDMSEEELAAVKWAEDACSNPCSATSALGRGRVLGRLVRRLQSRSSVEGEKCAVDNDGTCWAHGDNFNNLDRAKCPPPTDTKPKADEGKSNE